VVEAAGHCALVSPRNPADPAAATELVEQLAVLIDADLPFKIGNESAAYPVTGLLDAVHGLIDGIPAVELARRLATDQELQWATSGDQTDGPRVRRRLRSVNCAEVTSAAAELSRLG
jgi:hypothetical protein